MKIIYKTNAVNLIKRKIKNIIFNALTSKSPNLFLRGGDISTRALLIEGVHEKSLTILIKEFTKKGYSDFFLDIGANIGFNSCQSGNDFKSLICFEPNPLCINILKTNLELSLPEDSFQIYEFALGETDQDVELHIPKNNWGGAFIRSANTYTDEILASSK